jgi:hypothetical protein
MVRLEMVSTVAASAMLRTCGTAMRMGGEFSSHDISGTVMRVGGRFSALEVGLAGGV